MGWGLRLHGVSRHNGGGYDLSRLGELTMRVEGNWLEILVLSHGEKIDVINGDLVALLTRYNRLGLCYTEDNSISRQYCPFKLPHMKHESKYENEYS
jgi:hypothetical protein